MNAERSEPANRSQPASRSEPNREQPTAIAHAVNRTRRPAKWLAGVALAAASALLVSALTSIPKQIVDGGSLGDLFRPGNEIRVTTQIDDSDGVYNLAFSGPFDVPPDDPLRTQVSMTGAEDLMRRGRQAGGVDVGDLRLKIVLEGQRNDRIQITGMDLTDTEASPALRGTYLSLNREGGGDDEQMVINLADDLPALRAVDDKGVPERPYFQTRSISLSDKEQVVLSISVLARPNSTSRFRLMIRYIIDGETGEIPVDDNGQKFAVTDSPCHLLPPGPQSQDRFLNAYLDYDQAYTMNVNEAGNLALLLDPDPHKIDVVTCAGAK